MVTTKTFVEDCQIVAYLEFVCLQGLKATLPFTQHSAAGQVPREVMRWAVPFSVAPTKGISFDFFSSAYLYA